MMAILISLSFLGMPHAAYSQKTGEAQTVIVDANKHLILKFTNPDANKQRCAFLVGHRLTIDREEAFVIRVAHLHYRFRPFAWRRSVLEVGGPEVDGVSLPENGWLYITPSRIIFVIKAGDESHAFDVPRKDLKNKPVSNLGGDVPTGIQINLKERLTASDSREQKFVFLMTGDRNCQSGNSNDLIAGNVDEQPGEPLSSIDPSIPDDEPGRKGMYYAMLSARAASEGKMEEARSNAETALQLLKSPSNDSEFHARGVAQQQLGNYDLAIVDFDKALQLDLSRRSSTLAEAPFTERKRITTVRLLTLTWPFNWNLT